MIWNRWTGRGALSSLFIRPFIWYFCRKFHLIVTAESVKSKT
jgi:hypothetical protein